MHPKIQELLQSFFAKYKLRAFAKGEEIIQPGNKKIFFLTEGVVRMSPSKNIVTLNIYKPFSLFPLSIILGNKKDRYIYSSLTEVQGYFAPKKEFEKFIKSNPSVLFDLLKRIYKGLDGFFMRLETLLSGDAYLRILSQLVIYSKRFGLTSENKLVFDWHLTHQQLASETGLARESVTKEIRKLQKKGLVGYKGKKLYIYELVKLEQEYFSYIQK